MITATGNRMTMEIRRQQALAKAIEQQQIAVSTGRKYQHGSDDPVAAARVAGLDRMQSDSAVWGRALALGGSLSSQADGVLKTMADRFGRAQELVTQAGGAAIGPSERAVIAAELDSIATEVDGLANTVSSQNQPLFQRGAAISFRFDEANVFAPVPTREQVFEPGGVSLGDTLRSAAAAVRTGGTATGAALTSIAAAVGHVADQQAAIGFAAARIDQLDQARQTRDVAVAAERSGLADTDLTEAIATLNAHQLTLDAAQAAFARINRKTLFDILG